MNTVSPSTSGSTLLLGGSTLYWSVYRLVLLVSDALMVGAAFLLAYLLRFQLGIAIRPEVEGSWGYYTSLVAVLIPLWLLLFAAFGLYDVRSLLGGTSEYSKAYNACSSGMMVVVVASFMFPEFVIARGWLVMAWLASALMVTGGRFGWRRLAYALRPRGYFITSALIVGTNQEAQALAEQLAPGTNSGVKLLGFVDTGRPLAEPSREMPVLGTLAQLPALVEQYGVSEVLIATTALEREELLALFHVMAPASHVELKLSSGLFEVLTTGVGVRTIGSVPFITLNRLRLDPVESLVKFLLDYTLSLVGLLLLLPLFFLIALGIKRDSRGPVFYRRRVLGVGGRPFDAFKFRTMRVEGDDLLAARPALRAELAATRKLKEDPRVTRFGAVLRRYSLDELPQLFNVLLGQMSLVGPRMITPDEAEMYGSKRHNLLTVKPGLTGLWQVSGRSDVSYDERVRLDMYYIRNYSIWTDLQILFVQTLPAVLHGRGAY